MAQGKKILIKLSGESFGGASGRGICGVYLQGVAQLLTDLLARDFRVALVVGGGNHFRGLQGVSEGIERTLGDSIGMLATVMNGLALHAVLSKKAMPSCVLTPYAMGNMTSLYRIEEARSYLLQGSVIILAGGTGNPFMTTDTAAVLRALELECEVVIKATHVDGVYSEDPHKNPNAYRFDSLSYTAVLEKNLKVMDAAAIALARDNNMAVRVCCAQDPHEILKALMGEAPSTLIQS